MKNTDKLGPILYGLAFVSLITFGILVTDKLSPLGDFQRWETGEVYVDAEFTLRLDTEQDPDTGRVYSEWPPGWEPIGQIRYNGRGGTWAVRKRIN
jgi:hypothetical protein